MGGVRDLDSTSVVYWRVEDMTPPSDIEQQVRAAVDGNLRVETPGAPRPTFQVWQDDQLWGEGPTEQAMWEDAARRLG